MATKNSNSSKSKKATKPTEEPLANMRKCQLKSCSRMFEPVVPQQKYCSERCGNYVRQMRYQKRAREMKSEIERLRKQLKLKDGNGHNGHNGHTARARATHAAPRTLRVPKKLAKKLVGRRVNKRSEQMMLTDTQAVTSAPEATDTEA